MTIVDDFFEEQKKVFAVNYILMELKIFTRNVTVDEIYEFYKKKIFNLNLSPKEYEVAIKKLCDILEY